MTLLKITALDTSTVDAVSICNWNEYEYEYGIVYGKLDIWTSSRANALEPITKNDSHFSGPRKRVTETAPDSGEPGTVSIGQLFRMECLN